MAVATVFALNTAHVTSGATAIAKVTLLCSQFNPSCQKAFSQEADVLHQEYPERIRCVRKNRHHIRGSRIQLTLVNKFMHFVGVILLIPDYSILGFPVCIDPQRDRWNR